RSATSGSERTASPTHDGATMRIRSTIARASALQGASDKSAPRPSLNRLGQATRGVSAAGGDSEFPVDPRALRGAPRRALAPLSMAAARCLSLEPVACPAVRAHRVAGRGDVEEDPRMTRPQRHRRIGAMQREVAGRYLNDWQLFGLGL